jgi:hypothetical protein
MDMEQNENICGCDVNVVLSLNVNFQEEKINVRFLGGVKTKVRLKNVDSFLWLCFKTFTTNSTGRVSIITLFDNNLKTKGLLASFIL